MNLNFYELIYLLVNIYLSIFDIFILGLVGPTECGGRTAIRFLSVEGNWPLSSFLYYSGYLPVPLPPSDSRNQIFLKSVSLRWSFLKSRFPFLNLQSFHRIRTVIGVPLLTSVVALLQRVSLMARSSFKMEHPLGTTPTFVCCAMELLHRSDSFDFLLYDDLKNLSVELLISGNWVKIGTL